MGSGTPLQALLPRARIWPGVSTSTAATEPWLLKTFEDVCAQAHNFKHFLHKNASGPDSAEPGAAREPRLLKTFEDWQAHNFKQYFFHEHTSGPDSAQSTAATEPWLLNTFEGCMGSGTPLQALLPQARIRPGFSVVQ